MMANADITKFTLVPRSGVQFLVFGFDIDVTPRFSRSFLERPQFDRVGPGNVVPVRLLPGYDEIDSERDPPFKQETTDFRHDITKAKALEPFLENWIPVPFLAVRPGSNAAGFPVLAQGPSNWARVRVTASDKAKTGFSHQVVFAFDTQLVSKDDVEEYVGLRDDDARHEHEFMLAHRFADIEWYLLKEVEDPVSGEFANTQQWVADWIKGLFVEMKQKQSRRPYREEEVEEKLEYLARYIAFLGFLANVELLVSPDKATADPRLPARFNVDRLKLLDVSEDSFAKPVNVDLILDIGNSRTCGVIIETFPNEDAVDLGNSMVLQLRDLSRPEQVYSEPFESRVELAQAHFGPEKISKGSGRAKAFFWPSLVRIGPEAARFQEEAGGGEAASGMSSPKRYLWDTAPVLQPWKFQIRDYDEQGQGPMIDKAARLLINGRGDVLSEVKDQPGLYESLLASRADRASLHDFSLRLTASRSSFFTFMVAEVIAQALSMINNFQIRQGRKLTDAPRHLNRMIFTLPTAMPVREQRIMKSRVNAAIKLVWELMGWPTTAGTIQSPPEVIVRWDEASCVQFVYLYTEIVQKLGRNVPSFFEIAGRKRPFVDVDGPQKPKNDELKSSIRIASIDIGGGTTDLMITTYYAESKFAILPVQNFRESFRIAGDDILKAVIEQAVLPQIEAKLISCGVSGASNLLTAKFGGNQANMSEQDKHLRQQYVLTVLRPLGVELLRAFEASQLEAQERIDVKEVAKLVAEGMIPKPSRRIDGYLAEAAKNMGTSPFSLESMELKYDYARVRDAVTSVLDEIFSNIAEVLNHFDCDVVLLSGRPSRLPATVDLLVNKLATPPDRILPLHEYRVGPWYPFKKSMENARISDPKTATVVGGMLCALAERNIMNLTIDTRRLTMRSTAKFIGQLEGRNSLTEENVLFKIDGAGEQPADGELRYDAPMRIGFRQIPYERWTASPLYKIWLPAGQKVKLPIHLVLERGIPEGDLGFEDLEKFQLAEANKEQIKIVDAEDAEGHNLRTVMQITLNTMSAEDGYWLDTGILTTD
jgi:hypothetical protein